MSAKTTDMDLKKQAKECLMQIEPHAPLWIKIIRRYIRILERGNRK